MVKLSIVIPTLNQGRFIEKCIHSILEQSFKDFEIIIQDSMSTDDTEQICLQVSSIDYRIKYHREKDLGQSDAINRGLARSVGTYWTWLCSDDYYSEPDAINNLIDALGFILLSDSKVVGIFGRARFVSEDAKFIRYFGEQNRNIYSEDFKVKWPFAQPSSVLLRSAVIEAGGLRVDLHLGMDLDLFLRLTRNGMYFAYVDTMVSCVRLHKSSKSIKYEAETTRTVFKIISEHFDQRAALKSHYTIWLILSHLKLLKHKVISQFLNKLPSLKVKIEDLHEAKQENIDPIRKTNWVGSLVSGLLKFSKDACWISVKSFVRVAHLIFRNII